MEKVVNFPRHEDTLSDVGTATLDRTNRTFICTVLFLDIVEYSKKPVAQQLRLKEQFNGHLSEALCDIAVNDRIILDTGDGAAINFLGDPEEALFVGISLARLFAAPPEGCVRMDVRIGINLGPVRLVRDINGQPSIMGDGINVAERVMSFATGGQVLVSRSYYEVVTRISEDYTQLFDYQGSRTDKHVREHEIYEVASSGSEALDLTTKRNGARPASRAELKLVEGPSASAARAPRAWLPYATAAVCCLTLLSAVVYYVVDHVAPGAPKFGPAIRIADPAPAPSVEPTTLAAKPGTDPATPSASSPQVIRATGKKPGAGHKPAAQPSHGVNAAPVVTPLPAAMKTPTPDPSAPSATAAPGRASDVEPKPAHTAAAATTASSSAAAAPKVATALVTLAVSPWGEVLVDGKSVGVSPPLSEFELTPGAHRVEIRNGDFAPHLVTLQLESNQTVRIKHKFTQR